MRVFDDPNHPQYGPVRRMWVVLVQLNMLEAAERWSDWQATQGYTMRWDEHLATRLTINTNVHESSYQREIIGVLLEGWI